VNKIVKILAITELMFEWDETDKQIYICEMSQGFKYFGRKLNKSKDIVKSEGM
jgi:hypothetical protein